MLKLRLSRHALMNDMRHLSPYLAAAYWVAIALFIVWWALFAA